ncbi:heme ABC transporter ATP-binding protein [Oceanicoccus sagamiensis]|uniref:Heme ABC transporter ATP-binding protein n=1 Tax=Oceanicoccus sagamiensis TaxID=716816 RepID=A0A1X9N6N4_9GAMM|nr:heme ABC transporter ATP-binding protein [Oceanicoccus sagamiensis]ARN73758.1 heme ABC transporter ATP-binding protein [Oceanicoccus sagamiensis]
MLTLEQLQVSIEQHRLLDIDHFSLHEGEMFSVLGKNGAGKSTLFKAICGEMPITGKRYLHQRDIADWPKTVLAKHLAVLPQSSSLNFPFTVREVVALGLIPLSIGTRQGQHLVTEQLELTDTLRFADRSYLSLSGGERQRVHLARVLVQLSQAEQSPLLLLDEPTSAQDLGQQHQLLSLTKKLCHNNKVTALVIMHDLNLSMLYSDRVGILDSGRFSAMGPPAEVLTVETIAEQWGYRPQQFDGGPGLRVFI